MAWRTSLRSAAFGTLVRADALTMGVPHYHRSSNEVANLAVANANWTPWARR
jgi:hypothetical protein